MVNNPFIQKYLTLAKQAHNEKEVWILSCDALRNIVSEQLENDAFELMTKAEEHVKLSILETLRVPSKCTTFNKRDLHEFALIKL